MNVQNIPRSRLDIKRAFVPKLDCLVYFDYAAMEVRILAYYLAVALKDYSLVDEINDGSDIHRVTAARMFNTSPEDVTDDERQKAKSNTFGMIYGGGIPMLQRQGVVTTYLEGKKLIEQFRQARPGIFLLRDKLWESYEDKGFIRLIDGHRLHPESEHKSLNTLVQGTGAVIKRHAFVKCYNHLSRAGFKSHLVNEVHDDLQFDVSRGEIYNVIETIPGLMGNNKMSEIVPLAVDIEWSTTDWASKVPWEGEIK